MPETVKADLVVRRGEGDLLRIDLHLGGKDFPLRMEAARAAEVGRAMLAGATVARYGQPLAADAILDTCVFPVEEWWTGKATADGAPMLVLAVAGGLQIAFRFAGDSARACGESLAALTPAEPKDT